jgi:DNA-binding NarL/FixJ family response regulator
MWRSIRRTVENVRLIIVSDDSAFGRRVANMTGSVADRIETLRPDFAIARAKDSGNHIAVLDGDQAGAVLLCETLSENPASAVLVMGRREDDAWAQRLLEAGARGVLTTLHEAEEFAKAVRVILDGGIWARRRWISGALIRLASAHRDPAPDFAAHLSAREREVCRFAVRGFSNKELAARLDISEATVKAHLTHIFRKLAIQGRSQLAAVYHGFAPAPAPTSRSEFD